LGTTDDSPPVGAGTEVHSPWQVLGLLALLGPLVVLPAPRYQIFAGLPLDTLPALAALVLIVPAFVSTRARGQLENQFFRLPPWVRAGAMALATLALVGKLALVLFAPNQAGFVGCYGPLPPQDGTACASSFTNAFGQVDGTRIDSSIAFGARTNVFTPPTGLAESNWNLIFFNQVRFDYFAPAQPQRDRLPFTASWHGHLDAAASSSLVVRYVGEGNLALDGKRFQLAPSYSRLRTLSVPVSATNPELSLKFSFTHSVPMSQSTSAPYATLFIGNQGADRLVPAQAVNTAGAAWRSEAGFVDIITLALLVLTSLGYLLFLGRGVLLIALAAFMAWAGTRLPSLSPHARDWAVLAPGAWMLLVLLIFGGRQRQRAILVAYFGTAGFATSAAAFSAALIGSTGLNTVTYDGGGNDPLTYMSEAYSVLSSGSLKGGEAIFFYSPLYRYVLFALHIAFGDGSTITTAAIFAGLYMGLMFVAVRMWQPAKDFGSRHTDIAVSALRLLPGVALYIILAWFMLYSAVGTFLSEVPTWIFLLFAAPLLLAPRRESDIFIGTCLAGLAYLSRVDQAPGVVALVMLSAVALLPDGRPLLMGKTRRQVLSLYLSCGAILFGIASFTAAHDLYFGGRFMIFPGEASAAVNMPLPPSELLHVFTSSSIRATLFSQLRGVLDLPSAATAVHKPFPWAVHLVQATWLVAVGYALLRLKRMSVGTWALLLLPVVFLVGYTFAQVYTYYPRHVVAGYLMAGVCTFAFFGRLTGPRTSDSNVVLQRQDPKNVG
jgi:hypothetical protein